VKNSLSFRLNEKKKKFYNIVTWSARPKDKKKYQKGNKQVYFVLLLLSALEDDSPVSGRKLYQKIQARN